MHLITPVSSETKLTLRVILLLDQQCHKYQCNVKMHHVAFNRHVLHGIINPLGGSTTHWLLL